MIINHNMASLNTYRQLSTNNANSSKSLEKLSSGLRINRAGDDAAGLAISEKMRGQIRGLDQAGRNAQDAISMIQTAEGGLNEVHSILQRMREISVQASNDTNTALDRTAIGDELLELKKEVDRISQTTKFNGKGLLNGDLTTTISTASELGLGTVLATGGNSPAVSKIDVSGAKANTTYTFTHTADSNTVTLSDASGNSQQLTVSAMGAGAAGEQTLNFSSLGIKITIAGGGNAADTATNIASAFIIAANNTIATQSGTAAAAFMIGANGDANETLSVSFSKMDSTTLGSGAGNMLSDKITNNAAVSTSTLANDLTDVIEDAISDVSSQRSVLGAAQNRLEHTINNLGTSSENLTAAESRVRDVDMAKEMMQFQKNNILSQAAQAMLAQANQQPQGVLQLLR